MNYEELLFNQFNSVHQSYKDKITHFVEFVNGFLFALNSGYCEVRWEYVSQDRLQGLTCEHKCQITQWHYKMEWLRLRLTYYLIVGRD